MHIFKTFFVGVSLLKNDDYNDIPFFCRIIFAEYGEFSNPKFIEEVRRSPGNPLRKDKQGNFRLPQRQQKDGGKDQKGVIR